MPSFTLSKNLLILPKACKEFPRRERLKMIAIAVLLVILLTLLLIVLIAGIIIYNKFIRLRNAVKSSSSALGAAVFSAPRRNGGSSGGGGFFRRGRKLVKSYLAFSSSNVFSRLFKSSTLKTFASGSILPISPERTLPGPTSTKLFIPESAMVFIESSHKRGLLS